VEAPSSPALPASAAPASTAPTVAPSAGKALLGLSEIESLLQKQGIRVHELEVRDRVVEAEGRDTSNRKVEVIVDRRSGEILSRRFDD
jgi:peptidase YpeB-like protein